MCDLCSIWPTGHSRGGGDPLVGAKWRPRPGPPPPGAGHNVQNHVCHVLMYSSPVANIHDTSLGAAADLHHLQPLSVCRSGACQGGPWQHLPTNPLQAEGSPQPWPRTQREREREREREHELVCAAAGVAGRSRPGSDRHRTPGAGRSHPVQARTGHHLVLAAPPVTTLARRTGHHLRPPGPGPPAPPAPAPGAAPPPVPRAPRPAPRPAPAVPPEHGRRRRGRDPHLATRALQPPSVGARGGVLAAGMGRLACKGGETRRPR